MGKLSARTVATANPGRHGDGLGLWLHVAPSGAKKWVYRFTWKRKVTETGLGSASVVTLVKAREKAQDCRLLVARGINPVEAKRATASAAMAPCMPTFGTLADELFASKRPGWRSEAHAKQWQSSVERYTSAIRDLSINQIGVIEVLRVLQPIWTKHPETASRVRGRIEIIIDNAKARGLRSGENPAAWKGNLAHILPRRQKLAKAHFAAMVYRDLPGFMAALRAQEGIAARALEFLILTAARRSEVLGARWDEVELDQKIWALSATRMKSGQPHRVPLSNRACETLAQARILTESKPGDVAAHGLIFAGRRAGCPISVWKLAALLPPAATLHGFRSSFRDWCGEETSFPREIAEQALAHATGGAVELAYRRGDALEKRRQLMESWASYCEPRVDSKIVSIARGPRK